MNNKLLPCPFCGREALFVGTADDIDHDGDTTNHIVVCDAQNGGCGASGSYKLSKQEAIDAWNRRTPDIVHCGECEKIMTKECLLCSFTIDGYCEGGPDDDQFCSFGKRKEAHP